jgi:hypothetical protein
MRWHCTMPAVAALAAARLGLVAAFVDYFAARLRKYAP